MLVRFLEAFRLQRLALQGGDIRRASIARVEAQLFRDGEPDHLRLRQAAGAVFAASHRAFVGVDHVDAGLPQPADVALRRFVLPHAHVHSGHGHHRLVGRKDQRGRKIVGNAGRHLGEHVGSGRADDDQVGLAAQLDVAHLGLVLEVPQRGIDLVLAERGERHGGDELLPAFRHHAGHLAAALADQAHQLARLVGRDAAADDQQDTRHQPRTLLQARTSPMRRGALSAVIDGSPISAALTMFHV